MIFMLMIVYIIFIFIGVRKNKRNTKEYKNKKCFSVIVFGIANSILMLHDDIDFAFILYLKQFDVLGDWQEFKELIFFISIVSSLIALLVYINNNDES